MVADENGYENERWEKNRKLKTVKMVRSRVIRVLLVCADDKTVRLKRKWRKIFERGDEEREQMIKNYNSNYVYTDCPAILFHSWKRMVWMFFFNIGYDGPSVVCTFLSRLQCSKLTYIVFHRFHIFQDYIAL